MTGEDKAIWERVDWKVRAAYRSAHFRDDNVMGQLESAKLEALARQAAEALRGAGFKARAIDRDIVFDESCFYGLQPRPGVEREACIDGPHWWRVNGWIVVGYTEDDYFEADEDGGPSGRVAWFPTLTSAVIQREALEAQMAARYRVEFLPPYIGGRRAVAGA